MNFRALLFFVFVSTLLFTACEDDDDVNITNAEIIGKWALVSATETINGITDTETFDGEEILHFKEDGTYTIDFKDYDEYVQEEIGEYKVSGNKLVLTSQTYDEEEVVEFDILSYSKNSITFGVVYEEEFLGETVQLSIKSEYERIIELINLSNGC